MTQQLETLRESGIAGSLSGPHPSAASAAASKLSGEGDGSGSLEVKDRCKIHAEKLSVYCWTCRGCICHQVCICVYAGHNKKSDVIFFVYTVRFVGRNPFWPLLQAPGGDLRPARVPHQGGGQPSQEETDGTHQHGARS